MKLLLTFLALLNISFASVIESYLDNLKVEAKKNDSSFVGFDVKGEKLSSHQNI